MPLLEKQLEAKIGKYAKSHGCLYYKFSSPGNRGVPDRIVISPDGGVLFLEIKAEGKTPTALQLREINRIRSHGTYSTWVDSLGDAKTAINKIL